MPSYTLAYVRELLWKYASGVPYVSATNAEKQEVTNRINQVRARFFDEGKPRGTIARARFKVYDEQITLPSTLETVLGCSRVHDANSSCSAAPMGIYSQWFEFQTGGPGNPVGSCWKGLVDLGDQFATFRDSPYDTFYIRSEAELVEGGNPSLLIKGLDADFAQIYQADGTEGIELDIVFGTPQTTTQVFRGIYQWVKIGTTNGVVRLYAIDVATSGSTLIAIIAPQKVVSGYRRYRAPWPDFGDTVETICKRTCFPLVTDNDVVIPSNIGALKLGLMALEFEDRNDVPNTEMYWQRAYDKLEKERQEFDGDSLHISVQMSADYGAGDVVNNW